MQGYRQTVIALTVLMSGIWVLLICANEKVRDHVLRGYGIVSSNPTTRNLAYASFVV